MRLTTSNQAVLKIGLLLGYAAIPLSMCIYYISRYAVNGVWQDEWAFIPYLQDLQRGNLDVLNLLVQQHNEHHVGLAVLFLLIVANSCHYDGVIIQYVGLALAVLTTALLASMAWERTRKRVVDVVLLFPIIILCLSLRQWENLICCFPYATFLVCLLFVATIWLLDGIENSGHFWLRNVCAIITAGSCVFTFGNGVLTYPLAMLSLVLQGKVSAKPFSSRMKKALWAWGMGGLAFFSIYAQTTRGFRSQVTNYLSLHQLLHYPGGYLRRACASFATAVVGPDFAMIFGLALLAILSVALYCLIQNRKSFSPQLISPVMLLLFGLTSTLLIFYARSNMPWGFMLSSRYATLLNLWVSGLYMALLTMIKAATINTDKNQQRGSRALAGGALATIALLVGLGFILSVQEAVANGEAIRAMRLAAANILLNYKIQPDEALCNLCYSAKHVHMYAPYLETHKLSVFYDSNSEIMKQPEGAGEFAKPQNIIVHIDYAAPATDTVATRTHEGPPVLTYPVARIAGWIANLNDPNKIARVFVRIAPDHEYEAVCGLRSREPENLYQNAQFGHCGFSFQCDRAILPTRHRLLLIGVDNEGRKSTLSEVQYEAIVPDAIARERMR
jgi:hypothetical protein